MARSIQTGVGAVFTNTLARRLCLVVLVAGVLPVLGAASTTAPTTAPATQAVATAPASQPAATRPDDEDNKQYSSLAAPRVAHVRLTGRVLSSPLSFTLFGDHKTTGTLRQWLDRLARLRGDDRVSAVALELDNLRANWAQSQELADAVRRLGAKKHVYAYVSNGSVPQYLIASACKDVTLEPTAAVMLIGVSAELMFFRGTLDWMGIQSQFVQIGRYKGAAEPFTHTQPSRELAGQYDSLLDDLYAQMVQQVARQRRLDEPHVRRAIDAGPLTAGEALRMGLVDRLMNKAQWTRHVRKTMGDGKGSPAVWMSDYGRQHRRASVSNPLALLSMLMKGPRRANIREPTVAIIHADGMIISGASGENMFGQRIVGSRTLQRCFQEVAQDDRIKAVVFRINSPGGSALASELICQAVAQCAARKPVIASISQVGASGGYYIAIGADTIIADPSAIVGSIGVVSGKLAITGLLEKLRIGTYEITRGKNAGLGLSRTWNESELAAIRKLAETTYRQFVRRVAVSRKGKVRNVDEVAQGRVFTGRQAAANGLIDRVGTLRDAVAAARTAANLTHSNIITLPQPRTLMDMFSSNPDASTSRRSGMSLFGAELGELLLARGAQSDGLAYLLGLVELLYSQGEHVLMAIPSYLSIRY